MDKLECCPFFGSLDKIVEREKLRERDEGTMGVSRTRGATESKNMGIVAQDKQHVPATLVLAHGLWMKNSRPASPLVYESRSLTANV